MLSLQPKIAARCRFALASHFAFISILFIGDIGATPPLPVVFYSKMPADWLSSTPQADERLSYQALRLLLSNNAALTPAFIKVSHSRAELLAKGDPSGCLTGVLNLPQRQQHFIFSLPFTAVQGMHLFVNQDSAYANSISKLSNANGDVSLTTVLLHHRTMLIGIDLDRSYGAALDSILQQPSLQRNTVFRQSGADIGELWHMLEQGRVDAVLEYPFLISDDVRNKVQSVALSEVSAIETAYIACNKSAKGQAIIQRLNTAIESWRFNQVYIDLHLSVIAPQQHPEYLQLYREAMLTNHQ